MQPKNIYIAGEFAAQERWNDLLSRLTWYFTPFLDQIGVINLCASEEQLAKAENSASMDPLIARHLPALKQKIRLVTADHLDQSLARVDGKNHLFLMADESLAEGYKRLIGRFRPHGRFYRIDPEAVRMEGSFLLWAGINAFTNPKQETEMFQARFQEMAKDIGQYEKAYIFGTGPGLSNFVEGHDFSDGLTIIANSIVLNHDMLDAMSPRIIVAADPIFHAGCSRYAAAFREALAVAMEKTGAWFCCPLRDIKIYQTYLPEKFHDKIIGIPFDNTQSPPVDLTQRFALKPYPNILTLMLLPMASTFARSIHIAGCDGRDITEDSSFWTHDKKTQFNDEMDNIKQVHPGFFAIDYNDYYFQHARDLERVLIEVEQAGRRCVNESPSFIPALDSRSHSPRNNANAPFAPDIVAIIDPDAKGDWGHFLAYDRRFGVAVRREGLDFAILGRLDLPQKMRPDVARRLQQVFTNHSWTIGNKWPDIKTEHLTSFAFELSDALLALEAEMPDSDILLFMYCGSVEVAEMIEYLAASHPRMRAVITLFWSYNFQITDAAYREYAYPILSRLVRTNGPVRIMHATPQISREYNTICGLDIPVLPHPSTTFDDEMAGDLANRPVRELKPGRKPRVLFPGGARLEKGYLLGAEACLEMMQTNTLDLVLRTRFDANTPPAIRAAVDKLDPTRVELSESDLGEEEFVTWLDDADIIVIPYLPSAFSKRTSGMLVDAMLLGIPIVAVEGTWLADELIESGAGVSVPATVDGIVTGARAILDNYAAYAGATRAAATRYLEKSGWQALAETVFTVAGRDSKQMSTPSTDPLAYQDAGPKHAIQNLTHSTDIRGKARDSVFDLETARQNLELSDTGETCTLLAFDNPIQTLAYALEAGRNPDEALADWKTEASEILDTLRQNRARLVLVERDSLLRHPENYRTALDNQAISLPDSLPAQRPETSQVHYAVASACVNQDSGLRRLLDELRASSIWPIDVPQIPPIAVKSVLAQLSDQREQAAKANALQETEKKLSDLEKHLMDTRAEAQKTEFALAAKSDQMRLQSEQIAQLRAISENDARQVTTLNDSLRSAQDQHHHLSGEIDALRGELEHIFRSKSWKITKPMRGLRRLFSRRKSEETE